MTEAPALVERLLASVIELNGDFGRSVSDVDDETFRARLASTAPSIAFHLWHIARWADAFQARLPTFAEPLARLGPREEIWSSSGLARVWGIGERLGRHDTGWGLDDDASAALPLPGKDEVLGFATSAFREAEEVFGALHDDELPSPTGNPYDEEGWVILDHFGWYTGHGARHLGMIEALKGIVGMRGTVTS